MLHFPARCFVRFFENHGLLSVRGQPQWLTVSGGSQRYVDRLVAPFADRIRTSCGARRVVRGRGHVTICDACGNESRYDKVIFACHADEALATLADPSEQESRALRAIGYQRNIAILHKNASFMPRSRRCWASWVYHSDHPAADEPAISLTYWMNSLQGIRENYPLFVTLNPSRAIAPEDVFDTHVFMHPVFDFAALEAQVVLRGMQGQRNTWFCGAHLGHGFHEDGLVSAMHVAAALGVPAPWLPGTAARAGARAVDIAARGRRTSPPAEGVLQPAPG
jgi:predicted NAD/FAD-binding protein